MEDEFEVTDVVSEEESNEIENEESAEESNEIDNEEPTEELAGEDLEEAKEEVKDTLKRLNIKVDGKEIEREIDVANEEELIKILQMAEMANSRAQEAAELRKTDMNRNAQLEEFLNELKTNPASVLDHLGVNVNDFAEGILSKEVEKMQMSPEELELAELREELTRIKEAEARAKEEADNREKEALRDRYAADMEKNLLDSIKANDLPDSPHIINQLVNMISTAHENGIDLDFADVAPLVKAEHEADLRSRISGLSADDLVALLSEDKLTNLVAKRIPKVEKKAPPTAGDIKETGEAKDDEFKAKYRTGSMSDFFSKKKLGR